MNRIFTSLGLLFLFSVSAFAQLPGRLDPTFITGSGANNSVYYIQKHLDGKCVIGGEFTTYAGISRPRLARLNSNGTLDQTFPQGGAGPNGTVWVIKVYADGKMLIGGNFTQYNGVSRNRVARLNADGSLDQTFNPGSGVSGASDYVYYIDLQTDGKILVGGRFTSFNNTVKPNLVRLNPDGSVDSNYGLNTNIVGEVVNGVLQPDGKLVLGGDFTSVGGQSRNRICRLMPNGTLDTSFKVGSGASHPFRSFALQPDGRIIAGGYAVVYNNKPINRIARLLPNGTLDTSFFIGASTASPVYAVGLQPNGKVLVMGNFTNYNNSGYSYLVRLNSNGRVDTSFKTQGGPNNAIQGFDQLEDGRILLGGFFTSYSNQPNLSGRVARIFGDFVPPGPGTNRIQGRVMTFQTDECNPNPGEKPMVNRIIQALPGPIWGITDSLGRFELPADTGTYTVNQIKTPAELWLENQVCPPNGASATAAFGSSLGDTVSGLFFSNSVQDCPFLIIDVGSNRRRRCFNNSTYILVKNEGISPSAQVQAYLQLPQYVNLVWASDPYTFEAADSAYRFTIPPIAPNSQYIIRLIDSVSCVSGIMGLIQCTKAWIRPGNTCLPPSSGWDGVNLSVSGECSLNTPYFTIRNTGNAMGSSRTFQLFADSLLVYADTFLLGAGDSLSFMVPAPSPNTVYRVEVPQSPFHPFSTFASAETSCSFFPRPAVYFPPSDEDPVVAEQCLPIRDSYDPNDKQVFPKGSTADGNVLPNRYFDYLIRFQNTGNDTAYKVVVVDTLDENFDFSTFEAGASSHSYVLNITGTKKPVVKWIFNRIMLVDSNTNAPGSIGFFRFRIRPKATAPLGTRLQNFADIYFDFNDPIRTNTTVNTLFVPTLTPDVVDSVQIVTRRKSPLSRQKEVSIFPNPGTGKVQILAAGYSSFRILDVQGRTQFSGKLEKGLYSGDFASWDKGLYLIELSGPSGMVRKKWVLR